MQQVLWVYAYWLDRKCTPSDQAKYKYTGQAFNTAATAVN